MDAACELALSEAGSTRDAGPSVTVGTTGDDVPVFAYSHKEIDAFFDRRLRHADANGNMPAEIEAARTECHREYVADVSECAIALPLHKEASALVDKLGLEKDAALAELMRTDAATLAGSAGLAYRAIEIAAPFADKQDRPLLNAAMKQLARFIAVGAERGSS
jgi:hypothetical protein